MSPLGLNDQDQEDEDEIDTGPAPASTIAGPQTPREQVMSRIAAVRGPGGSDPVMQNRDTERDAALQFAKQNALTSGIGRAINAFSAGTGYKPDDSAYDAIDKQTSTAFQDLSRSDAVRKAVENRQSQMAKAQMLAQSHAQDKAQMQANADRTFQQKDEELDLKRGEREDTQANKMATALKTDLDPNAGRAGNMGFNQKKVDAADRLLNLVKQGNEQPGSLDKRQVEELAIGLNSMLSNSSAGAASQVQALVPHTMWGGVKDIQEWITNNPTGKDQQAFINRMAETIQRERDVASDQVRTAQVQRLGAHGALKNKDPDTYNSILSGYGIDPSMIQSGKYVPPQRGKNPGAPPADGSVIPSAMAGEGGPKVGTISKGYMFLGGNANDPHSWVPVKK